MFANMAISRIVYHPHRKDEILFAEVNFFSPDGTKFLSMNISAAKLPPNIKEGKQVYFTMQPPVKEST